MNELSAHLSSVTKLVELLRQKEPQQIAPAQAPLVDSAHPLPRLDRSTAPARACKTLQILPERKMIHDILELFVVPALGHIQLT